MTETTYKFHTVVEGLYCKKVRAYVSGVGDTTVTEERDLGWFVLLRGSRESLYLGSEQPEWELGDKIEVTMKRKQT